MRPLFPIIYFCMLLLMFSCQKKAEDYNVTKYKIGMVTDHADYSDNGFRQTCMDGLIRARDEFVFKTAFLTSDSAGEVLKNIDSLAGAGYNLVYTLGYSTMEATLQAAGLHPSVSFVLVDGLVDPPVSNIQSVVFQIDEAAFPLGFLAAAWADLKDSLTPAAAFVGGMDALNIHQFTRSYLHGVTYYNAKYDRHVDTLGVYANSYSDLQQGMQLADSLISAGADVIFAVGSITGNGALVKAMDRGKWGIGVDVDQYYSFPQVKSILLSSCMKELDNAVYSVCRSYVNKQFQGGTLYTGNLKNEGVGLAPYHDYETLIPDSIKQDVETIRQGIMNGTIHTGW